MGLNPLTANGKHKFTQLRLSPDYDVPKRILTQQIIGVEDAEKMTFKMTDQFWNRSEFSLNTPQSNFTSELITAAVKESNNCADAQILENLPSKEKGYMCLIVYTKIINHSIALIRREVSKILLKKSLELAQTVDSEDMAKQDE